MVVTACGIAVVFHFCKFSRFFSLFLLALQVKYSLSRQSDGNLIWYIYGEFASVEDYNKHASQQYEHVSLQRDVQIRLLFLKLSSEAAVVTILCY